MKSPAVSILIVDDEQSFRETTCYLLAHHGYQVETVATGQEAAAVLSGSQFDAILLDLVLPDCNGIELASQFGRLYPWTAIIILTGMASIDSAVQSMRHGICDYLHKPSTPAELLRVVARCVENRRLQQELQKSQRKYQQLADAAWEGIVFFGETGIVQANRQFSELFGYLEEELPGLSLAELIEHWQASSLYYLHDAAHEPVILETAARHRSGRIFPVEIRIRQNDDPAVPWVAAVRDISQRKQAEQKATKLQEHLRNAQRMESIGRMVGGVAHDLNNILTSIVTYPELLLLDIPEGERHHQDLTEMRAAGKQAAAIVADLLTVARGATANKDICNLNRIVTDFRQSIEMRMLEKEHPDLRFSFHCANDLAPVKVSELHVRQSLLNLLINSAQASRASGKITISTKNRTFKRCRKLYETIPPGSYAIVQVEDEGEGIDEAILPRIFEPFFSKKQMGRSGTGLGLAIVYNTLRDHQGFIDVSSGLSGSCFTLYFPVSEEALLASEPEEQSLRHGHGEAILIVDDDSQQLRITASILDRLGYDAYQAATAEEAFYLLEKQPLQLVILDKWMGSGENGLDIYRQMLAISPQQRALLASGYLSPDDQRKAAALGIQQCLAKPFSVQALAEAVDKELGRK